MDYHELFHKLSVAPEIVTRHSAVRELNGISLNPTYELYNTPARDLTSGKPWNYLLNEFAWYLNGDRSVEYISKYSTFWNKIADTHGCINSNYGNLTLYEEMPNGLSPLEWCVHALEEDINTRQAVMLYNKPQYITPTKDFICTQLQHFLYRNKQLNSIVYMRSSDLIRGLSFDIPWWKFIQDIIANTIDVKSGELTVFIGSSHVYKEHYSLVNAMLSTAWMTSRLSTTMNAKDIFKYKKWDEHLVANNIQITVGGSIMPLNGNQRCIK